MAYFPPRPAGGSKDVRLRNWKRINVCCFNQLACGDLLRQPPETNTAPRSLKGRKGGEWLSLGGETTEQIRWRGAEAAANQRPADMVHTDQLPTQRWWAHSEEAGESCRHELKPHSHHSWDAKAVKCQPKSFLPVKWLLLSPEKGSSLLPVASRWLSSKGCSCQSRRRGFDPWGQEDPLEKEKATHSNSLAGEIPRTEETGGLQSLGSQRVRHD